MSVKTELNFTLNGRPVNIEVPVDMTVLDLLRDGLDLKGTKYACGEGECGACTIEVDGATINSCLMYAADLNGRTVMTIEGLGAGNKMHPMQQSFVDHGAVQCGFCMPGMIIQANYLVKQNPNLTREEMKRGLEGNICRCTGYTKVLDAVAAIVGAEG
ncbi:Xanthine dehydrogenase iron-sulfur subunit [hydrothermal vent metagenome]|uniref:Xanthine dehydrogenase iron-sulfur subunit n=1 Tax=hydrothermal vent metagenome TaxID=652676 RepID=A0A3B0R4I5_9ZZZZ